MFIPHSFLLALLAIVQLLWSPLSFSASMRSLGQHVLPPSSRSHLFALDLGRRSLRLTLPGGLHSGIQPDVSVPSDMALPDVSSVVAAYLVCAVLALVALAGHIVLPRRWPRIRSDADATFMANTIAIELLVRRLEEKSLLEFADSDPAIAHLESLASLSSVSNTLSAGCPLPVSTAQCLTSASSLSTMRFTGENTVAQAHAKLKDRREVGTQGEHSGDNEKTQDANNGIQLCLKGTYAANPLVADDLIGTCGFATGDDGYSTDDFNPDAYSSVEDDISADSDTNDTNLAPGLKNRPDSDILLPSAGPADLADAFESLCNAFLLLSLRDSDPPPRKGPEIQCVASRCEGQC